MKVIVLILLSLLSTYTMAKATDPASGAALFVDGFLRGALQQEIGRVDECLSDADTIVADVGRLLTDVEGRFDLMGLVLDIGKLLTDVPNSIKDCHDLPDTVKDTFAGWVKKIKNPINIAKIVYTALSHYRGQLQGDANSFLAQWRAGDFEASGLALGDIPHTLFDLCQPAEVPSPDAVARFLDGFLRSALDREIGEVDRCLTDADSIIDDIEKFVSDIEAGFDLLPIITDLGKFLTDIPSSIKDCDEFVEAVEQVFDAWEAEIKSPVTVAKIVYVALSQHEDRLTGDAAAFVAEWRAGNYENSGKLLGDIPHVLFDICPAEPNTFTRVQLMMASN